MCKHVHVLGCSSHLQGQQHRPPPPSFLLSFPPNPLSCSFRTSLLSHTLGTKCQNGSPIPEVPWDTLCSLCWQEAGPESLGVWHRGGVEERWPPGLFLPTILRPAWEGQ